jgi:hypothetical protein
MVAVPAVIPVATPDAFTAATLVFEELHCAEAVKSCVVPSEYVPMALKETVADTTTDAGLGETEIPVKDAVAGVVGLVDPVELVLGAPLHAARSIKAKPRIPIALVRRTAVPPRDLFANNGA